MNISDITGNRSVDVFNEVAEKILGMSAQELGQLKENNKHAYFQKLDNVTLKRYAFILKKQAKFSQIINFIVHFIIIIICAQLLKSFTVIFFLPFFKLYVTYIFSQIYLGFLFWTIFALFQSQSTTKFTCVSIAPLNHHTYMTFLLDKINTHLNEPN